MFYLLYKIYYNFSGKERLVFAGALMTFVLSGAFAGTNAYYAATDEIPAAGGTYAEGMLGQPTFINPLIANGNEADFSIIKLVFTDLRDLMDSYAVSPDKKTWTITLKKNLLWDNGKKLTADDVVFSVETIQDPNAHSPLAVTWNSVIAEKINDDEVRFTLKAPYAFFLDTISALSMVPQNLWGIIPAANLRLSKYNLEPVGNGPYMFNAFTAEKDGFISAITLVPNPHYHGAAPFIQTFIIRFYRNEKALINDFNSKKINGLGGLNPELASSLTIGHRLITLFLPRYYALFFNPSAHPALQEKKVRQTLALVIDRAAIIRAVFKGYAALAAGPIPPVIDGYEPAAREPNASNPRERANQLLDEAGWLISPDDGIRRKTINKKVVALEFNLITPDIPFLDAAAESVKNDFGAIGIKINLVLMAIDNVNKNALKTRNYHMILFGNILKNNPDVFAFWHSSQKFYPGLNLALYENKTADNALETLRQETDAALRNKSIRELEQAIADDAPAAFLFNPAYLYAVPENLRGFTADPIASPAERFNKINEWHLKTKRVFAK